MPEICDNFGLWGLFPVSYGSPAAEPASLLGLALLFGLVHGYLNGTLASPAGLGLVGLAGIATTVFVLVALLASLGTSLRTGWHRIAARVAGSWIAAIGLLMIGWALRP